MSLLDLLRRKMFCAAKLIGCFGSFVGIQPLTLPWQLVPVAALPDKNWLSH